MHSAGQRPVLQTGILERSFPDLVPGANSRPKLLYTVCGTADDHLNLTCQFDSRREACNVPISKSSVRGTLGRCGVKNSSIRVEGLQPKLSASRFLAYRYSDRGCRCKMPRSSMPRSREWQERRPAAAATNRSLNNGRSGEKRARAKCGSAESMYDS